MKYESVKALYYITSKSNLASIFQNGICSHDRASGLTHDSIAKPEVQKIRARKRVPGSQGRPLHEYVNLYFNPRNPMLFLMKENHENLVVLDVDKEVMKRQGVAISDYNAAKTYTAFHPYPEGIEALDESLVFARYWVNQIEDLGDPFAADRRKAATQAEVLVPDLIEPQMIKGVIVSCKSVAADLRTSGPKAVYRVDPNLFFRVKA